MTSAEIGPEEHRQTETAEEPTPPFCFHHRSARDRPATTSGQGSSSFDPVITNGSSWWGVDSDDCCCWPKVAFVKPASRSTRKSRRNSLALLRSWLANADESRHSVSSAILFSPRCCCFHNNKRKSASRQNSRNVTWKSLPRRWTGSSVIARRSRSIRFGVHLSQFWKYFPRFTIFLLIGTIEPDYWIKSWVEKVPLFARTWCHHRL